MNTHRTLTRSLIVACLWALPVIAPAQLINTVTHTATPATGIVEKRGSRHYTSIDCTFENAAWPLELESWSFSLWFPDYNLYLTYNRPNSEFWRNVRICDRDDLADRTALFAGQMQNGAWQPGYELIPTDSYSTLIFPDVGFYGRPAFVYVRAKFRPAWISNTSETKTMGWTKYLTTYDGGVSKVFPVGYNSADFLPSGQTWFFGSGGSHESTTNHRRALMFWGTTVLSNQRFAHDLGIKDANGSTTAYQPYAPNLRFASLYYCWNKPVYAMAAGTVVHVRNDVYDNLFASGSPTFPANQGGGNRVVIEHASGEFSVYCHLRKGSVPSSVYPGATVTKGQQIGRIGNSGNSTEPHLHFAVIDRYIGSTSTTPPAFADDWQYQISDSLPAYFSNTLILREGIDTSYRIWTDGLPSGIKILPLPHNWWL